MSYILFFDSGIGGLTVLHEAIKLHPEENYIFFADEDNLPYGNKTPSVVRELTLKAITELRGQYDIRAIVISCNTATSAAISKLRETYTDIPIIGIEPAVKPACERHSGGKVGVMATDVTLSGKKFSILCQKYEKCAEIIPIPAPGLVEIIEKDSPDSTMLEAYLKGLFSGKSQNPDCIVLGCTHYPFVREAIAKASGCNDIIDGALGTVRQLFRQLSDNLESDGKRVFLTSGKNYATQAQFAQRAEKFLMKL